MDAQDRILGIIKKQIEAAGFQATTKGDWANTGHVFIAHPDEFGALARVRYDFQANTCKFAIYVSDESGNERGVPSQPGRADYFDFYQSYTDRAAFARFTETLGATLKGLPKPQPTAGDDDAPRSGAPRG